MGWKDHLLVAVGISDSVWNVLGGQEVFCEVSVKLLPQEFPVHFASCRHICCIVLHMRKIGLIVLCFCIGVSFTQEIELKNASSQNWSGGIAGRSGCKFLIQLESSLDLKLDSIYIGDTGFSLTNSNRADLGNIWFKNKHSIHIIVDRIFSQHSIHEPSTSHDKQAENKVHKIKTPMHSGEALLIYRLNGQRKTFEIARFDKLPTVCYP